MADDLWYLQNLAVLQQTLNIAAEKMNVALYTPDLDDRFLNMSRGNVLPNKTCQCHATPYNVFSPPNGSVCSWSCILTIASGCRDPREIEGSFPHAMFPCHNGQNIMNAVSLLVMFSEITNVSIFFISFHS